jgi:hypothetical protein
MTQHESAACVRFQYVGRPAGESLRRARADGFCDCAIMDELEALASVPRSR